jgi:pilus assembly protein CpaD
MTRHRKSPNVLRFAFTLVLCGPAVLLAGCSQEFAKFDDTYVPITSDERFPIEVTDRPVKLSVAAYAGKLANEDVNQLVSFARAAQSEGASPVIVSYPSGSKKARGVSQQAIQILQSKGLRQENIRSATYNGKSDVVNLSFTRKIAATKECGDWSEDLAKNPKNEPYPNYGCFLQNNLAAMVVNPEDFVAPPATGPGPAAPRAAAISSYQTGEWTDPSNSDGAELSIIP